MDHPKSLAVRLAEERRGAILRALSSAPSYKAGERLLHDFLDEAGLPCSRDQVRTDMAWLRDIGMVIVQEVAGVMVAEITQGGLDVGKGRVTLPGIARPDAR